MFLRAWKLLTAALPGTASSSNKSGPLLGQASWESLWLLGYSSHLLNGSVEWHCASTQVPKGGDNLAESREDKSKFLTSGFQNPKPQDCVERTLETDESGTVTISNDFSAINPAELPNTGPGTECYFMSIYY